MSAAAYIPASRGIIRKSICRLEARSAGECYEGNTVPNIVRRSSLELCSSVDCNSMSVEWSLELPLAPALKVTDCMTARKGETVE